MSISPLPSMTMTSTNPSINISVATKYLDPGERGAQVRFMTNDLDLDLDKNDFFRMCAWFWALCLLGDILTLIIGILRQGDENDINILKIIIIDQIATNQEPPLNYHCQEPVSRGIHQDFGERGLRSWDQHCPRTPLHWLCWSVSIALITKQPS